MDISHYNPLIHSHLPYTLNKHQPIHFYQNILQNINLLLCLYQMCRWCRLNCFIDCFIFSRLLCKGRRWRWHLWCLLLLGWGRWGTGCRRCCLGACRGLCSGSIFQGLLLLGLRARGLSSIGRIGFGRFFNLGRLILWMYRILAVCLGIY